MTEKGGSVSPEDPSGSFLYKNNELITIFTPTGRMVPIQVGNNVRWKIEYNITDHLGNVRAVFAAHNHGQPELMQQTSYYPFGMTKQQQNYCGPHNEQNKILTNVKFCC